MIGRRVGWRVVKFGMFVEGLIVVFGEFKKGEWERLVVEARAFVVVM